MAADVHTGLRALPNKRRIEDMPHPGPCNNRSHSPRRFAPLLFAFALAAGCGGGSTEAPQGAVSTPASAAPTGAQNAAASTGTGTTAPARSPRTYSGPDIAGIFIGMTQAEVEAVIRAYDPEAVFQYNQSTYRYTALDRRLETEPFLSTLVAGAENRSVIFQVRFSPPPGEGRVVGIRRNHNQRTAPLTQADYAASLVDKYGAPSEDVSSGEGNRVQRKLTWRDTRPGRVECVVSSGTNLPGLPLSGGNILDTLSGPQGNLAAAGAVDNCALVMTYQLNQDPVFQAGGLLYDVEAAAKGEQAAQEWVRALQAEASRPGTERPTL